ncbi:MAG: four helix bundle protein [Chthoniobacterales bacterium]|nr:four helix bundle protein [Chthoniobacterales bacterium]
MRLGDEIRDRTKQFASRVVRFYAALPRNRNEVEVLGHQLLRSGTSVAAHVREASRARSDTEFCSKLEVALQEADESQLWLELLRDDCGIPSSDLHGLIAETEELISIFVTIIQRTRRKNI